MYSKKKELQESLLNLTIITKKKVTVQYERTQINVNDFIKRLQKIEYCETGDIKFYFREEDELNCVYSIWISEDPHIVKTNEKFLDLLYTDIATIDGNSIHYRRWCDNIYTILLERKLDNLV